MRGEKVVVPLSGGISSIAMLYYLDAKEFTILPITFDWKQFRKTKIIDNIKRACEKLNLKLTVIDVGGFTKLLENARDDHKVTMNRDLLYISIASAYALTTDTKLIYYPFYKLDESTYHSLGLYAPMLRDTFEFACGKRFHLAYDFWTSEEWELIELGNILGIDWNDTWSCYYNGKNHCGKCLGCQRRIEAFRKAGIADPTKYTHKPKKEALKAPLKEEKYPKENIMIKKLKEE